MTLPGQVWAGPIDLPRAKDAMASCDALAQNVYGPIPDPPDDIAWTRTALAEGCDHLRIALTLPGGVFHVDAALWVPPNPGPVPLIVGLDFLGPLGVLNGTDYPLDPNARIYARPELGGEGALQEIMRGATAYRWPVAMAQSRGYGVLQSCYGSWVPDDAVRCSSHGIAPLLAPGHSAGAISLWAWALMRLVDVAQGLPQIDLDRITLVGHSRLGKAALWAGAWDARVHAVWANNSGCAGAAPAGHPRGETLAELSARFPHWLRRDPSLPDGVDQHHLLQAIRPRAVYLSEAEQDHWADPLGAYMALVAASERLSDWPAPEQAWQAGNQIIRDGAGYHLRAGGHEMLPWDWQRALDFLDGLPG